MVAEVVGQKLAAFVKTNNLDGVDIDFEGDLFNTNAKDAVKWLIGEFLHGSRGTADQTLFCRFANDFKEGITSPLSHQSCPHGSLVLS
jgi:hypothetical protein